ncbi:MAG: methyltransferase, partial [Spirochaetales bacterium]
VDVIGLWNRGNLLGVPNSGWKSWSMPDGTPVEMPGGFEYSLDGDGAALVYPQGDRTAGPSLKLPKGGFFLDNIPRAEPFSEEEILSDPAAAARRDFKDLYGVFSDEDAEHLEIESRRLFEETDYGIIYNFGVGGLGDAAIIPGPYEKNPRGIRRLEDWYMAHLLYPEYIHGLFEMQTDITLKNLEIARQAVGERIQVVNISGSDFGSQQGEMISVEQFREFYKPCYKKMNDWVHRNTKWKTHFHCCGSILRLLPEFIECGVDVLNPVQWTAAGMDPVILKKEFGGKLVFWGGGINTQKTLPFGTPEEVRREALEKLAVLAPGGGFVFNTIHNILGKTPPENIIALFDTALEFGES